MDPVKNLILFFVGLTTVGNCEVFNIGIEVGRVLEKINEEILSTRKTSMIIQPGIINENISYLRGLLIGLNSMVGTGNCLLIKNDTVTTYDLHLGFSLLSAYFPNVNIIGKHMSTYFRIRANSFNIRFKILNEGRCKANLEKMQMKAAALVQNGASLEEYDQLQLDRFFQVEMIPRINQVLKGYRTAVEDKLQKSCEALRKFDIQNLNISKFLK